MKKKLTIKQMVKEIVFDATTGNRSTENYVEGMMVIDSMQYFYYRSYFEDLYDCFISGERTSRSILVNWFEHLEYCGRGKYGNKRAKEVAGYLRVLIYGKNA